MLETIRSVGSYLTVGNYLTVGISITVGSLRLSLIMLGTP